MVTRDIYIKEANTGKLTINSCYLYYELLGGLMNFKEFNQVFSQWFLAVRGPNTERNILGVLDEHFVVNKVWDGSTLNKSSSIIKRY